MNEMKVEVFSPGLFVYLPKWQDRQISLLTSADGVIWHPPEM
jgi:hypothetical protein